MPILGAAGAENWHFGVAIPMEITSLGSFRNADVPISSEAHVRSGNLVSDSRSDHGKVSVLRVLEPIPPKVHLQKLLNWTGSLYDVLHGLVHITSMKETYPVQ